MYKYTDEEIEKIINITKKYEANNFLKPSFYLLSGLTIYIGGIYLLYSLTKTNYLLFKITTVFAFSLLIVRNFMIFHDLGHSNYFPSDERKNNEEGINTFLCETFDFIFFFPGRSWRLGHKEHHKVHGNIDIYDTGRTITWTTDDYNKSSKLNQYLYDIFRYPVVFFMLTPIYIFVLQHVIDINYIYFTKLGIFLFLIYKIFNIETLILFGCSLFFASLFGLILFHLQHSINEPFWKSFDIENDINSKMNAELNGSSVLKIPLLLKPFTNGIEYHNVHHLNPGVPSYNIKKCYEELRSKDLLKNREIDLYEMLEALTYTIYDNDSNKYIYHYKKTKIE